MADSRLRRIGRQDTAAYQFGGECPLGSYRGPLKCRVRFARGNGECDQVSDWGQRVLDDADPAATHRGSG